MKKTLSILSVFFVYGATESYAYYPRCPQRVTPQQALNAYLDRGIGIDGKIWEFSLGSKDENTEKRKSNFTRLLNIPGKDMSKDIGVTHDIEITQGDIKGKDPSCHYNVYAPKHGIVDHFYLHFKGYDK